MPNYNRYTKESPGVFRFHDDEAGTSLLGTGDAAMSLASRLPMPPKPSEGALAQAMSGGTSSADGGLSQAPAPPPVASDAGPNRDSVMFSPPPVAAPPAPPLATDAGMSVAPAKDPLMSQPPPAETRGPSSPSDFESRTNAPPALASNPFAGKTGQQVGETADEYAIRLGMQASEAALRGSPGHYVPGGEFQTARAVQRPGAIDPKLQAEYDKAQRQLAIADSDVANFDARVAQEEEKIRAGQSAEGADHQARLKDAADAFEMRSARASMLIDKATEAYTSAKVDPNRWWNSRTRGQTVAAYASVILGAFGSHEGAARAWDNINGEIARDIQQQEGERDQKKAGIDVAKGFYQHAKDALGSAQAASDATYIASLKAYEAKLLELAASQRSAMTEDGQGVYEDVPVYDAATDSIKYTRQTIVEPGKYSQRVEQALAQARMKMAEKAVDMGRNIAGQESVQYQTKQGGTVGAVAGSPEKAFGIAKEVAKIGARDPNAKPAQGVMVNGQFLEAHPGIPEEQVKDVAKRRGYIATARSGLERVKQRLKEVGSIAPDDPVLQGLSMFTAGPAAQAIGSGVPSETNEKVIRGIFSQGVRTDAALKQLDSYLDEMDTQSLQSIGARAPAAGGAQKRYVVPSNAPRGPMSPQPPPRGPMAPPLPKPKGPMSPGYFEAWEEGLSPETRAALAAPGSISQAEGPLKRGPSAVPNRRQ